jgi:hypothetical protein
VNTGDTVSGKASIVFDLNEAIETNSWRNTFDATAPTSTLNATISQEDSSLCLFSFIANDDANGSGVDYVDLYFAQDDGEYVYFNSCHPDSTIQFSLIDAVVNRFVSVAVDHVGNREPFKTIPDTVFDLNHAPRGMLLTTRTFFENAPHGTMVGEFSSLDDDITKPFVYMLVDGEGDDDNALFTIEGDRLLTNANYNCDGQVVISGEKEAVEQACAKAKESGAKRALPLPVSGAFHSPLMEPARVELAKAIEQTEIVQPCCPVYQNVCAAPVTNPTEIKKNLLTQLTSPVKWTQSVQAMLADGADWFMEVGPGTVLQGLVRRISGGLVNIEGIQ